MYTGGCLCGAIRFEIHGKIHDIVYCHCSRCRKAQGSAFATNGNVEANAFRIVSGEDLLNAYESSPGEFKCFCKVCGSPILSRRQDLPQRVRVRLGTIDSDIDERPRAHIFAGSRANWETICGDLPQYDGYE